MKRTPGLMDELEREVVLEYLQLEDEIDAVFEGWWGRRVVATTKRTPSPWAVGSGWVRSCWRAVRNWEWWVVYEGVSGWRL